MILIAVLAGLAALMPLFARRVLRRRLEQTLARQLRQSLQSFTHGLRTGMSFLQTLERVAQEEEEPLAREWKKVVQAVQIGIPLRQALTDLGQQVPLKEMTWFITAIQVTQETGGSAAGVLETLAATLQERETLREKMAALTAQGRASGAILAALPFLMLIPLYAIAPELIRPLFVTSSGQMMLAVVVVLVTVGGGVIYKIVSLKPE